MVRPAQSRSQPQVELAALLLIICFIFSARISWQYEPSGQTREDVQLVAGTIVWLFS